MVRNILAVIAGLVIGGLVNMGIVMTGGLLVAPPESTEMVPVLDGTITWLVLEPKHLVAPFLAHALGSLVGAAVAALISTTNKMMVGLIVGFVTLLGGIAAAFLIRAPMWFVALDLIVAYIPMAWIGAKLGGAGRAR
ncbi:MAG: hypothetical protein IPM25_01480 [Chloracidobacterium sp.]|nr:hypothetical protein [Chloracidobacterium sp.]